MFTITIPPHARNSFRPGDCTVTRMQSDGKYRVVTADGCAVAEASTPEGCDAFLTMVGAVLVPTES